LFTFHVYISVGGLFEAAWVLFWLSDRSCRYVTGCSYFLKPSASGTELANNILLYLPPRTDFAQNLNVKEPGKSMKTVGSLRILK
jgi:hypothetical protein